VLSARGLRAEVAAGEAHRHAGLIRRHAGLAGYRAGGALHALSGVERAARLQTGLQNSVIVAGEPAARAWLMYRCWSGVIGVGQADAVPAANPTSAPAPSVAANTRMTLLITVAIGRPLFLCCGGVSATITLNRNIAPAGPKL
jgi:hypothetical protein